MMKLTNKTIPDVNRSDSYEQRPEETSNFKSQSTGDERNDHRASEGDMNPLYQTAERTNSYLNIQDNAVIDDNNNTGYNDYEHSASKGKQQFSTFNAERSNYGQQYNNAHSNIEEEADEDRSYSDKPNSDYYDVGNNNNNYTLKKAVVPKKSGLSGTGFTHKTDLNDDISKDFDHSRKPFNYTGFSKNDSDFNINDGKRNYIGFNQTNQKTEDENFGSTDNKFRSNRSLSISDNNANTNTNGFMPKRSSDVSDHNNNEPKSYHYNYEEMSNNNSDYNPPNFSDREDFNTNSKDFIDSPSDKPLKDEEISIEKKLNIKHSEKESPDIVFKKINPNNQNNVSNINVNNSNLNDIIKRDLQEYLSNLESQNVIKLSPKAKNKWVLEFKDNSSNRDGTSQAWMNSKESDSNLEEKNKKEQQRPLSKTNKSNKTYNKTFNKTKPNE
jgi:hypothetical protein